MTRRPWRCVDPPKASPPKAAQAGASLAQGSAPRPNLSPVHGARSALQVVDTVLTREPDIDLVVFSGDMLSGWMGEGISGWVADK